MAEGEKGNGAGAGGGDWREALPEAVRADPALKDFKDPGALATSYLETKKLVGGSLRPPGPEASPEARKEFADKLLATVPGMVYLPEDETARADVEGSIWAKLGRPKEATEYAPPKGVELPADALDALRAEAAEEGLTRKQFEARAKRAAGILEKRGKEAQEMKAALKRELGAAYDERMGQAVAVAEKVGFPPPLIQALKAGEVDLTTFTAIAAVAKGFGQSIEVGNQNGGQGGGKPTPAEAKMRMAELRGNPAYFDSSKPEHKYLQAKMVELAQLAFPES
jgi:hypothetical protein